MYSVGVIFPLAMTLLIQSILEYGKIECNFKCHCKCSWPIEQQFPWHIIYSSLPDSIEPIYQAYFCLPLKIFLAVSNKKVEWSWKSTIHLLDTLNLKMHKIKKSSAGLLLFLVQPPYFIVQLNMTPERSLIDITRNRSLLLAGYWKCVPHGL